MDFTGFYNRIPFITRYWFTITVGLSYLAVVRFIDADKLPLYWDPVINQREIWRPLTAVFYCPPKHFFFFLNNYFLYRHSVKLESQEFASRPHDYLTMLIFNWLCCLICAYWFGFHLLLSSMAMSVVTVWCQYNPDAVISTEYLNGKKFKAAYLPWAILGANILYSQRYARYSYSYYYYGLMLTSHGKEEFAGMITGYLTYYLLTRHPTLLQAPDVLKQLFGNTRRFINTCGSSEAYSGPRQQARFSHATGEDYHPWGREYTCRPNPPPCAIEARMHYKHMKFLTL